MRNKPVEVKLEDVEVDDSSDGEWIQTPPESVADVDEKPKAEDLDDDRDFLDVEVHPAPEGDGILVSVHPPTRPKRPIKHVPCDIVLTIDVSGSMQLDANPPPTEGKQPERTGLTVLDLTKHGARTIVETLDEDDRLSIVTFSSTAKVVQKLLPMTENNKKATLKNIKKLQPEGATNLWHGILKAINVFEKDSRTGCVPAIMVLTDGQPNHQNPAQGFVPKLMGSYTLPASLHTFGFGYDLRSGLLKALADYGGGNYSFIPDSGMLGTVFVHAVANLQSTYAPKATLTLKASNGLVLEDRAGSKIRKSEVSGKSVSERAFDGSIFSRTRSRVQSRQNSTTTLSIKLDTLQYGQSRDIFLPFETVPHGDEETTIEATLQCEPVLEKRQKITVTSNVADASSLRPSYINYHRSRVALCEFLGSIFPVNKEGEHKATGVSLGTLRDTIDELAETIRAHGAGKDDDLNTSLVDDLIGEDPNGQIRLALSSHKYFNRWGKHYLLSLLNAHQKQICNSFKDNGPLQYGKHSPLFIACRDALDHAFDNLPPPTPSAPVLDAYGNAKKQNINMASYNNYYSGCFTAESLVSMADGRQMPAEELRKGMEVLTPTGSAKVEEAVAMRAQEIDVCVLGALRITPWHPIQTEDDQWRFPADVTEHREKYNGIVYSILLERDSDADAHALEVGGQSVVALGHGVLQGESDARAHAFYGDYDAIETSLRALPEHDGVRWCDGAERDPRTGLICGYVASDTGLGAALYRARL